MARLNKKILCFIDECGTAGQPNFALGCVMVWAKDAGRADKALSDLLEPNVNELHAVNLQQEYLQSLLARFAQTETPAGMVMLNKIGAPLVGSAPQIYAGSVIEAVKIAAKQFRDENNIRDQNIGNVELILDRNEQNTHPDFLATISRAKEHDGRFKAVTHVMQIDSAASRLLQLADVVAYARIWIHRGEENADGLRQNYKIRVL
jgi:hypothetical protein